MHFWDDPLHDEREERRTERALGLTRDPIIVRPQRIDAEGGEEA